MNQDIPTRRRMVCHHTPAFDRALKDACANLRKLPQPNYNDENNLEDNANQRNSYSCRRGDSYGRTNYSPRGTGRRPCRGTYPAPDRCGRNMRYNSQRARSYTQMDRNSRFPNKNKTSHAAFNHPSSGNYGTQITSVYTSCNLPFNDSSSSSEHSNYHSDKSIDSISDDHVSVSSTEQSTWSVDTAESLSINSVLETKEKSIPSYCEDASDSMGKQHKDALGFRDSSSDYESQEDASVSGNSFCKSNESYVNIIPQLGSCDLCYIPPPIPPSNLTCDKSCSSSSVTCDSSSSYHEDSENVAALLHSSDVEDSSRESDAIPQSSTTNSTSSCDLIQPSISSECQRICHYNNNSVTVTVAFPVEDSDNDECEETSEEASFHDSPSTVDMVPEQTEAISKLLKNVENDRATTEHDKWEEVVEKLTGVVKKCIRGCWLNKFGSYVSGFAIGTSDMNFAVIPNNHINSSHKLLQDMVKPIQKDIPDCNPVYDGNHDYKRAHVTFCEPKSNIYCKIQILKNDNLCRTAELLHCYGELDERVRTLVISVRHWAEVCEILEVENGRLHPLSYVLMMIHFLQQCNPPVLPIIDPKKDLQQMMEVEALKDNKHEVGYLWVEFLKYYSEIFNWKDNVVSITSRDPVLKASKSWGKCWIAVEEPYDEAMNVAKSVVSQDVSNYIWMVFVKTYDYFSHPTPSVELDDCSDVIDDPNGNESSTETNGEDQPKFDYEFYQDNFLNGLCVPVVCSECEHLGHLCDTCLHEENTMLHSLPKMTPEFLLVIDKVLSNMYEKEWLSEMQLKKREYLVERLEKHIKKRIRNVKIELIGSTKNGFGLKDSDVDTCFTIKGKSADNIEAKYMVKTIKNILLKNVDFTDVIFISTSKIPIVKFIDRRTKLRCDISIYNELAVCNTRLLNAYSRIDKRVKILGCAMKNLAKNACINDTAQRTLSSYSYILMVLYFLQQVEPPVIPVLQELYDNNEPKPVDIVENEDAWFFEDIENLHSVWDGSGKNCQSAGELWVGLLEFYTTKFNFQHFISISQKSPLKELENVSSSMLFNIQDPFIKSLNLGSRTSRDMSRRTLKALQRARILFGTPVPTAKPPSGFDSFEDYFFSTLNLTEGRVTGKIECSLCGKFGHRDDKCRRHKLNHNRLWNRVLH